MNEIPKLPEGCKPDDQDLCSHAWLAHQRLMLDMMDDPRLRDNPVFTILRQDAYAMLVKTFGGEA